MTWASETKFIQAESKPPTLQVSHVNETMLQVNVSTYPTTFLMVHGSYGASAGKVPFFLKLAVCLASMSRNFQVYTDDKGAGATEVLAAETWRPKHPTVEDVTRPGPSKGSFLEGKMGPLVSGKSRLVKYYSISFLMMNLFVQKVCKVGFPTSWVIVICLPKD